jgi:enamine deaminase RidA (YjgF/YER057c/UK114 family)
MSIQRLQPGKRLSQAVVHGGLVHTAGIVADDPVPDAKAQTEQILARIDRLLAEGGTDKSRILTATIWLSDIRYYAPMNEAWDAWVAPGNAKLAAPPYWVEIRVVAAI